MQTLSYFGDATRAWFHAAFAEPTRVQRAGWPHIAAGTDALLLAPTGSGKTLAAFLFCIDRMSQPRPDDAPLGWRAVYISPLKALVYDVERNLRAPLAGIGVSATRHGLPFRPVQVDVRTGDTPQDARRRMSRHPGDILITTPESLYLILGSEARKHLATVETVIIDEIHALAPTKRGAHLSLSMERLSALPPTPPQRLGLSATVRPPADVAHFLTGGRPCKIVDVSAAPTLDLGIIVPLEDMSRPGLDAHARLAAAAEAAGDDDDDPYSAAALRAASGPEPATRTSVWPAIEPKILELVQQHRSTIVFVNSRGLAERLAQRLNELADEPLVRAHHGSISHAQRGEIEELLKHGQLKGIVATSSLELGIDMGAVDLVVQVASPGSTARGLQRVGRSGHGVGEISIGRIFPKFRGDLLECTVIAQRMALGAIEPITVPTNALDVVAQQIVAMCAVDDWTLTDLARVVRGAWGYRNLTDDILNGVLDMLSGRYPSTEFADLRPRLTWDRTTDTLKGRKGSRFVAAINGGTIPDRGLYRVTIGPEGPRIGELDEEMVYEARVGETIILGASTWRIQEITRDRVAVEPAPGEPGKLPFWHGEGPGRPIETGRAIGAFLREVGETSADKADAWLRDSAPLDALARKNLLAYVAEQREATGALPTDRAITVERFRDELGDWRVCLLTPFGARVHAPWALALENILSARAGFEVQTMSSDDGIVLRFADTDEIPSWEQLTIEPEEVEELIVERLADSSLFAAQFRENAARALLLPRRNAKGRTPLWQQRLRSANLMAVARQFPAFPIILETYRACLQDVFDLDALKGLLTAIRDRTIRVDEVETETASPFARSLAFAYVAAYLYDGDAPLAERKAQALTLDRNLLRELLGGEQLRDLLDADVIAAVEAELQLLTPERAARADDHVHDLLRRLGGLTTSEVRARSAEDPAAWLKALESERRVVSLRVGGEARWVCVEDVARYRDALGAVPPSGLPKSLLEPVEQPFSSLVVRYARTHGPFRSGEVAARLGVHAESVENALAVLVASGRVLEGAFLPGTSGREWCDPDVLRRIRRRTLAQLRQAIEPVDAPVLARFLWRWHGHDSRRGGLGRLSEAIGQLEGLALPFSELEKRILPSRVPDYRPAMLDELGAMGQIVWVGRGSLGARNGRVALYRRETAALLLAAEPPEGELSPLHAALLDHLGTRGASFLVELQLRCGSPPLAELMTALWDLVWAGVVTNDTFQPLRNLASPARQRRATARRGARAVPTRGSGGRWSLVAELAPAAVDATKRAHALTQTLLERYGVVSREVAQAESLAGGFTAVYPVLRSMEELGHIRRGYFVEGLSGAQFAMAGAVDRLRAERADDDALHAVVLPATDPSNPYGALLSWPDTPTAQTPPRRAAGASVVLVDGHAALFVNPRGRRASTFPAMADDDVAVAAFGAMLALVGRTRTRMVTLERIDGQPPRGSRWEPLLKRAGFLPDYRGMVLTAVR